MNRINQWQMTLRWTFRVTVGFFVIYGVLIAVKAPFVYAKVSDVLPEEMKRNFIGMAIVAPFIFSVIIFIVSMILFRLIFALTGMREGSSPNTALRYGAAAPPVNASVRTRKE